MMLQCGEECGVFFFDWDVFTSCFVGVLCRVQTNRVDVAAMVRKSVCDDSDTLLQLSLLRCPRPMRLRLRGLT